MTRNAREAPIAHTNLWATSMNSLIRASMTLSSITSEAVKRLNQERLENRQKDKARRISEQSPEKLLGYFLIKNLNDSLGVNQYIDLMQTATDFRFCVADLIDALIYARLVHPCSKSKTFDEVIPRLFGTYEFTLDQLYSGLEYIGSESEKIVEIYSHQISRKYRIDTSHTYLTLTAQISISRLTTKTISAEKARPKKTKKIPSSVLAFF